MAQHVEDKVVVITGAASGFGRLVAQKVAQRGGRVVAADIDEAAVEDAVEDIAVSGGEAIAVTVDVTDLDGMRALADAAVAAFGRIDVMVNNAGIMPLAFYADHATAAPAWDRCIDVNLKGVLHGIIAVHDQMLEQGRGQIVNISSIYGNTPTVGAAVYAATKAAVNVLSEALRAESQGRIKVTTVKPTGVPGTGLGGSIVNGAAIVGLLGQNADSYWGHIGQMMEGTLPAELTDPDDIRYWAISPDQLAEQVLWVIDQPWGVSISDVTVRASGEEYLF
jgi:NADP-dependent 3-hydroxy acid dehydrogenase YdfG